MTAWGAEIDATRRRLLYDDIFYEECLREFASSRNIAALQLAMREQNAGKAFDAAHELKGTTVTLGLTPLYEAICALVDDLRSGWTEQAVSDYEAWRKEYMQFQRIASMIEDKPQPCEENETSGAEEREHDI